MLKYKGIVHNVLNDAPFIGAIIIAPSCSRDCKNCINEHLKTKNYIEDSAKNIISKVKANGLNKGVILSGLEWTESPKALIKLVKEAQKEELKVMIYTHHVENYFKEKFSEILKKGIYIKYGAYIESLKKQHFDFGVKLATENQCIKKY